MDLELDPAVASEGKRAVQYGGELRLPQWASPNGVYALSYLMVLNLWGEQRSALCFFLPNSAPALFLSSQHLFDPATPLLLFRVQISCCRVIARVCPRVSSLVAFKTREEMRVPVCGHRAAQQVNLKQAMCVYAACELARALNRRHRRCCRYYDTANLPGWVTLSVGVDGAKRDEVPPELLMIHLPDIVYGPLAVGVECVALPPPLSCVRSLCLPLRKVWPNHVARSGSDVHGYDILDPFMPVGGWIAWHFDAFTDSSVPFHGVVSGYTPNNFFLGHFFVFGSQSVLGLG